MSEVRLTAEPRTEFGKGGARRTRRAGKIPAVLYGHGQPPVHISLPSREYAQAIKQGINALLEIDIEGKKQLALTKALQRDAVKRTIDHVDLLLVHRGEKVRVEIPIVLTGETARGGLLNQELNSIPVQAEATHLPESVEVNLSGLAVGHQLLAKDVILPKGATLDADPQTVVVGIIAAPTAAQVEAELSSAEAGLGIQREASQEQAEATATTA